MQDDKIITVDGVEYVPKLQSQTDADGAIYSIIRTKSAGVFAGYVKSAFGQEAVITHARRLWYWDGAASLSQLSQDGVSKPENCKFPCEVPEQKVFEVIEVIACTKKAKDSIESVPIWKS